MVAGPIISPQTLLYCGSSHQDYLNVSEECVYLLLAFASIHKLKFWSRVQAVCASFELVWWYFHANQRWRHCHWELTSAQQFLQNSVPLSLGLSISITGWGASRAGRLQEVLSLDLISRDSALVSLRRVKGIIKLWKVGERDSFQVILIYMED